MNHRVVILALSTLILAACSSAPQRVAETRNTPAPVEDRVVGAAYVPPKTHVAPVTPAAAPAAPWNNAQLEQACPAANLGNFALSTLDASAL